MIFLSDISHLRRISRSITILSAKAMSGREKIEATLKQAKPNNRARKVLRFVVVLLYALRDAPPPFCERGSVMPFPREAG